MLTKVIENGYIIAVGTNLKGTEITEAEYNTIMEAIQDAPHTEGKGYRLKADLTWEEYELPEPSEEIDDAEALSILTGEAV